MKRWTEIQPKFRAVALQRGSVQMAKEIPASRASVYRWANGKAKPNLAAQERITQILKEKKR